MSNNIFLREHNSPNIVIEPIEVINYAPMPNEPNTKTNYFEKYESPNIVITPNATICNPPSPKRIKLETLPSPEHMDTSFLDDFNVDEIVACLNTCDNIQETEINYEKIQTAQCEPIEQTVLNKDDLITPHEDFIYNNINIVDNVEDSLKRVNNNLTNKINAYECIEKGNNTVFEINERSKEESNVKIFSDLAQNNITCTETPSAMVPCDPVEHKKERTKRKPENDIGNFIIININVNLVVNGCRDVKKSLRSKNTTENKTINNHEHTESEISVAKPKTDQTTIYKTSTEVQKKLGENIFNKDTTPIEEKKNLEGELNTGDVTTEDITPMKDNKNVVGEPKTNVVISSTQENKRIEVETNSATDITSTKEMNKLEGKLNTGEVNTAVITPMKYNKDVVGEPKTTVSVFSIQENKRLEVETNSTTDITSIKEMNKLEGELNTAEVATADITPMKDNKDVVGEPKTTVAISSIQENKRLEVEPNSTKITFIKELEIVDKSHAKPIRAKSINDEKVMETEVNKLSIAGAKTDGLQLIQLEQQMHSFLHKKISVLSIVHCGSYSKIFKCKDPFGEHYAVKMLKKDSNTLHGSSKDKLLKNIQSDIPKKNLFCTYLYESFAFNGHCCFLLDYYPKNLNQAIKEAGKPFNINKTQELASQLVGAVLLLRNNNIVHSDIKPNHILLNSANTKLKLCGFDNAYYLKHNTVSKTGALYYRPPEVILGCPHGFKIDVWSTALVLYEMVTGTTLFPGYSNSDMLYRQMKALGSIPEEMRRLSANRNKYFYRDKFLKLSYYNKVQRSISMSYFTGDNTILDTVYLIYTKHWGTKELKKDKKKLDLLLNLLKQMLVLHPKRRLSIEFVCANPFIYELFSN